MYILIKYYFIYFYFVAIMENTNLVMSGSSYQQLCYKTTTKQQPDNPGYRDTYNHGTDTYNHGVRVCGGGMDVNPGGDQQCHTESNNDNSLLISTNDQLYRQNRRLRRLILQDLLCLSAAFTFVYMAFVSLQTLQSSLNSHEGLGVASLCWIYSASVISCLIAPMLMRYFTTRWTILIGFSCFLLYLLTNLYPVYFVILPASLFFGLTFGPMWSAQSTHLTILAIRYGDTYSDKPHNSLTNVYSAEQKGLSNSGALEVLKDKQPSSFPCPNTLGTTPLHRHENVITMFNAIFCSIFQTCHLWGNLLSSTLLFHSTNTSSHIAPHLINYTRTYCGANNCARMSYKFPWSYNEFYTQSQSDVNNASIVHYDEPSTLPHHLHPISSDTRLLLLMLYVICVVCGIILLYWKLDNLQLYTSGSKAVTSCKKLLFDTVRMFGDSKLQLLVPLVVFVGLQQAFIQGDFTMVSH